VEVVGHLALAPHQIGRARPSLGSWIDTRFQGQKVTGALIAAVRSIVCEGAEGHDPAVWATTRVEMAVVADSLFLQDQLAMRLEELRGWRMRKVWRNPALITFNHMS
jgi:hypothetical protein